MSSYSPVLDDSILLLQVLDSALMRIQQFAKGMVKSPHRFSLESAMRQDASVILGSEHLLIPIYGLMTHRTL